MSVFGPGIVCVERRFAPFLARCFRETGGVRTLFPEAPPFLPSDDEKTKERKMRSLLLRTAGVRYLAPLGKDFPGKVPGAEVRDPEKVILAEFDVLRRIAVAEWNEDFRGWDSLTGDIANRWLRKGARVYGFAELRSFPECREIRVVVPKTMISLSAWMASEKGTRKGEGKGGSP